VSFIIGVPKETDLLETRATLVPSSVEKLVKKGATVEIEAGMGVAAGFSDDHYIAAGAVIAGTRKELLSRADLVAKIRKPSLEDVTLLKPGAIHISFLDPFREHDLINALAEKSISAISLEMIPRVTRAQKMDVLSSQASLAGYVAVILAAERLPKIFPLMMTPAGTLSPARVFIIGAGVAGLQAIATAKRLGARVEAFDTRPAVEEQVLSLGAKFVKVDMGTTGETQGGYAKALSEEQLEKQRAVMAAHCAASDVIITTAQVFGKKAPILITKEMIAQMSSGAVVVDLAVESGGNVEGIIFNEEVVQENGVRLIGLANLPGRVPRDASAMLSSNITALIEEYWDMEAKRFQFKEDEILKGCLVTHEGHRIQDNH
jgi:NAD(P) transhydrogenase subunit alpha